MVSTPKYLESTRLKWIGNVFLVAVAYWIAARFSLLFTVKFIEQAASPFWPPSGIALYLLLSRDRSLWPGIALGHFFVVGSYESIPFATASIISAFAASGEALLSSYLIKRLNGKTLDLERMRGLWSLIGIGAILSPLICSFVSIGVWYWAGGVEPNSVLYGWRTFFLGDSLGVLVFTPLLLGLHRWRFSSADAGDGLEVFAMLGLAALTTLYIFTQPRPLLFLFFPFLCWAALRFRIFGVSMVTLIVSLIGNWLTVAGSGPLSKMDLADSIGFLQLYLGSLAFTGLFLTTGAQAEARHRALLETTSERKKFEAAAKNASDLIYEIDPITKKLTWLGRIDEALGYEPDEFPRSLDAWAARIHPEDHDRVVQSLEKSMREHTHRYQKYRMIKKDGSIAYWRVSAQMVDDDATGESRWVGAISDITEQQRAEAALRKSEERYQLATTGAEIGVWDWDARENRTVWSEWVAHLFGTSKLELSTSEVFQLIYPEDRKVLEARLFKDASDRKETYCQEFRVKWPDGSIHWLLGKGKYMYSADGQIIRATGTTQEITDSKRILDELSRAREAAECASRAKMEFLANMSHEIRTPMNAILGFTNLLSEPSVGPDLRQDFIARIKANGDQLLALVDDILDLSKFEAGKVPVERIQFSLTDLISQTLLVLTPLAEKKELNLNCEFVTPVPQVITSDPTRLRQILTNLIGNSIKFTEYGSIKIRLHFQPPSTEERAALRIDVEDSGIGISNQARAQLFRPFSQADSSVTRKFGGTGLGLTLSKKLAEALGGRLELTHSTPGHGSCFSVWIDPGDVSNVLHVRDLGEPKEPRPAAEPTQQPLRLKNLKILLAEDSPDSEALVKLYLSMEGAICNSAHDGLEALKMAQAEDYDAILMDVQMPNMSGLEATRRLRDLGFRLPIIALTAHALQSEIHKSIEAGCTAHLTKPISRKQLVEALLSVTTEEESSTTITEHTTWFNF